MKAKERLDAIYDCCLKFNYFEIENRIKEALNYGISRSEIVDYLSKALIEASRKYEKGEFCIPHLYAVASVFEKGYELVKEAIKPKGKVLICTLGSMHYLGKNIVRLLLQADGFEVYDLGENVSPEQVVEAVERIRPDIVALSVLIMVCLPLQREVERLLRERGLRSKVKLMIGGVVTSKRWAREIGADAWAPDGVRAVKEANRLLKELRGE
jgi:5-methyltetrahydrofolate--homocysteine methyltransferase